MTILIGRCYKDTNGVEVFIFEETAVNRRELWSWDGTHVVRYDYEFKGITEYGLVYEYNQCGCRIKYKPAEPYSELNNLAEETPAWSLEKAYPIIDNYIEKTRYNGCVKEAW